MTASRHADLTIGGAAERSGVSAKMIRYYEQTGLLPAPHRGDNGYRKYSEADVQILVLVHHARNLGFSIEEVRILLDLTARGARKNPGSTALAIAGRYRSALAEKMDQIKALDRKVAQCLCSDKGQRTGPSTK